MNLHNPWLNYTMGIGNSQTSGSRGLAPHLMDDLDERSLISRRFMSYAGGCFSERTIDTLFPIQHNRDQFFDVDGLRKLVDHEGHQWNPVKKRVATMIDIKKLDFLYDRNYEDY